VTLARKLVVLFSVLTKPTVKSIKGIAWKYSMPQSVPALKSWNTVIKFGDFDVLKQKLTLPFYYFTTCNFSKYGILSW
jgi:hypothetical protein